MPDKKKKKEKTPGQQLLDNIKERTKRQQEILDMLPSARKKKKGK